MYRTAYLSAYDVLDQVWVNATVTTREFVGDDEQNRTISASVQVRGTGETEDRRWLRDALVALAETL